MLDIFGSIWLILPAYFANSSATLAKGKRRMDFSRNFVDGRPIFGTGKTFEGFFLGVFSGTFIGFLQTILQNVYNFHPLFNMNIFFALSISSGALIGDLVGSFIKRRLNLKRGEPIPLFDQLDFVVGSLAFVSFSYPLGIDTIMFLVIITPLIHLAACLIGYRYGIKKEPW